MNEPAIPNRTAASQLPWLVRCVVHPLVPLVEYFRSSSHLSQGHLFISWYAENVSQLTESFSVKLLIPIQERDLYHGL